MNHITLKHIALAAIGLLAAASLQAKPKYVNYEKYGAVGDGVHDDMPAIVAAHKAANEMGVPVKVKKDKVYYIGGSALTAEIRTDTDFGNARFIIDDVDLENVKTPVFKVLSYQKAYDVQGVSSLKKGQKNIGVSLPCRSLVIVENSNHKVYIRKGRNVNNGTTQTEVFVADAQGNVQEDCPIIWDYDKITSLKAIPIDETPLVIKGGTFTTIANREESKYHYHSRGIEVSRSNVQVSGITHYIIDEQDHGAPYGAFIFVNKAADVVVENCVFTGHRTYETIGRANLPVKMGSYELNCGRCVNVSVKNCSQTNEITDTKYWGVFTSNFCKVLSLENCVFSRFDAHQGVENVSLRNCVFGHMGSQMVGFGTLLIENCEVRRRTLVLLRGDYGSSWDGNIVIRNCVLRPVNPKEKEVTIVSGTNDGTHDFGYECCLPRKVLVENLVIDDSAIKSEEYPGPFVFGSFGRNASAEGLLPYRAEGVVELRNVTVSSGRSIDLSPNLRLFAGYEVRKINTK